MCYLSVNVVAVVVNKQNVQIDDDDDDDAEEEEEEDSNITMNKE